MELCQKFKITSNMCGPDRVVKPSGILDLFQSVAGEHANELGIGMRQIYPQNYAWVLMRVRYEMIKPILMDSEVKVITWPQPAGRIDFDRDYLICDLNDNILVKGSSKWVVINLETRRIERTSKFSYPHNPKLDRNFEGIDKIDNTNVNFNESRKYVVRPSDIDMVGHLNNTKYADLCYDMLATNYKNFTINYNREIALNEEILIEKGELDDLVYIKVDGRFNALMEVYKNE